MMKTLIIISLLLTAGCGQVTSQSTDKSTSELSGSTASTDSMFLNAAKKVTPSIGASTAVLTVSTKPPDDGAVLETSTLPSGSIMATIYEALRDYEFPRDEGVIDMHNIYKVLC